MVASLIWHGGSRVITWWYPCYDMVASQLWHGCITVITWWHHCYDMVGAGLWHGVILVMIWWHHWQFDLTWLREWEDPPRPWQWGPSLNMRVGTLYGYNQGLRFTLCTLAGAGLSLTFPDLDSRDPPRPRPDPDQTKELFLIDLWSCICHLTDDWLTEACWM